MTIEQTISHIMKGQVIPTDLKSMQFDEAELIHNRYCLAYLINNRIKLSNKTILSLMYRCNKT